MSSPRAARSLPDVPSPYAQPVPKPVKPSKNGGRPGGNKYKARATKDESRVARRLTEGTNIPFERVPLSGARKHVSLDGDVRSVKQRLPAHRWLLELKNKAVTNARGEKQVTFDLGWLDQAIREAEEDQRLAALVYRYTGDTRLWVVLEIATFERLLREHKELTDACQSPAS